MTTTINKSHCIKCEKERSTSKCAGCSQDFCYNHLIDHRQELSKELDEIETNRDIFQQTFIEKTKNLEKHPLIEQINKWEDDSIKKIQQTAEECRQLLSQHIPEYINRLEINLAKLTDQIKEIRKENDFNEKDLNKFKQKLTQFTDDLQQPPNISIKQDSSLFINKISVIISSGRLLPSSYITLNTKWKQYGTTFAGGNGCGNQLNQLSSPQGIYVDDDNQCIYIADSRNDRIVKWKWDAKNGEVVTVKNRAENEERNIMDQLKMPTDVIVDKKNDSLIICDQGNRRVLRYSRRNNTNPEIIISDIDCYGLTMDNNGDLYVSDYKKHEVKRWKIGNKYGRIVAGGNGRGNHLSQLDEPTFIFVDQDYSVYVSDQDNHRVMKWVKGAKEGVVVAGGQGQGKSLAQLIRPRGIIVDHLGNIYVADYANDRIMRWSRGSNDVSIIVVGSGEEDEPKQFNIPTGLSFDREGNLYVVDSADNRVQKFEIN